MRENKELEPRSDSIGAEKALSGNEFFYRQQSSGSARNEDPEPPASVGENN
jgi:hypothetical protein